MASAPGANAGGNGEKRLRKILSLDGGGVRGLSTVIILGYLMEQLSAERGRQVEPWEEFDMIGGTSTGGLIGLMLGRLRMSVIACEDTYAEFSDAIFTPRRHTADPRRVTDFIKANGKFDEAPLEALVKKKLVEAGMTEGALFKDEREDACNVFVSVVRAEDSSPSVLRTYKSGHLLNRLYPYCKVWEAARATSAASTFFDPIQIGPRGTKFVDGGLRYNNPIDLVERESKNLWPDDDRLIISIGTGNAPGGNFEGSLKDLVDRLKEIATDTELTNNRFFEAHRDMMREQKLFRFNVHGLGSIGLDESKQKATIVARTESYIESPDVMDRAMPCVATLVSGGSRLGDAEAADEEIVRELDILSLSSDDLVGEISGQCYRCLEGIKYNARWYLCTECLLDVCAHCRGFHEYHFSALTTMVTINVVKDPVRLKQEPDCAICLGPASCGTECNDCQLCLCSACIRVDGRLKSWTAEHAPGGQAHRSLTLKVWPFVRFKLKNKELCGCRDRSDIFRHCGACGNTIGAGDLEYVCIDCLRDRDSTVNLCFACNETNKGNHREKHSFQVVLYQNWNYDVDNWYDQSRDALICNECSATFNFTDTPFPPLSGHPHFNFTVRLGAAYWDQLRHHIWKTCPKKGHLIYYPREITNATGDTCQCGEPIILDTLTSFCFRCRLSFCHLCVKAGRDFHRHELTLCEPLGNSATATYKCSICSRSQENADFYGGKCPRCGTIVCYTCLTKNPDHSNSCACPDPPTSPRWYYARPVKKRKTYRPPGEQGRVAIAPSENSRTATPTRARTPTPAAAPAITSQSTLQRSAGVSPGSTPRETSRSPLVTPALPPRQAARPSGNSSTSDAWKNYLRRAI